MPSQSEASHSKNRNFICSCGKAYLSYAALFTHIKQKHAGKAPGQIIRPRSENKRGRPRKNDKLTSEKAPRNESYKGFLDNNNQKNINFANESNFNENEQRFQNNLSKGFRNYKDEKQSSNQKSSLKRSEKSFHSPASNHHCVRSSLKQHEDSEMQFVNPNNELSSNTLALASIIIGLQQLFKEVNFLERVDDDRLEAFSSYLDLKGFHSKKLLEKGISQQQSDVFLLGNIICAFLNFCHQTVEQKSGYQQIVLLIVCLLEHVKQKKGANSLIELRKEVIHECLPSFFQQYLEKVIIKQKLNFWIFKQNNSFKVLIWFLNWLSVIEVNYKKNPLGQEAVQSQQKQEDDQLVQFDCPVFLKQIQKASKSTYPQKNEQRQRKRQIDSSQSKYEEAGGSEGSEQSEQQSSGKDMQLIEPEQNEQDSQLDPNESSKKQFIEMERLSSQVR